jgi:hypothetical protein
MLAGKSAHHERHRCVYDAADRQEVALRIVWARGSSARREAPAIHAIPFISRSGGVFVRFDLVGDSKPQLFLGFVSPAPVRLAGVFRQPRTLVSLKPIPQGVVHARILPRSARDGLCKIVQHGRQIPTDTSRLSLQIWRWIRYDRPSSQTEAP